MNGNREYIWNWTRPMIGPAMLALSLLFGPCGLSSVMALEVWVLPETRRVLREEPAGEGREPLLNYRAPAWIAWRYEITGLLYWGGMCFWRDVEDPWTDPKTLDRRNRRADGRGPLFNGEGTLVYPGRAVGYDGIASSLRLKALRDAIEDYEYLAILDRQGQGEQAREIVLPLATGWFDWQRDPAAYETARRRLAELILAR